MKNKTSWISWPLNHYPISLLIIVILFGLGIYGLRQMPKDEFPTVTIRQGVVVAVFPGATSEEVEQQVARPLERYLFTFGEVNRDKTTSTSQNGMCIVMVTLNDNVNNKDEVWSKIKHGLNTFKTQLPGGVLALIANDDFGNTSALLIAIESQERSYRELRYYTDRLGDRLRHIPSVANVKVFGELKEQISLYVDKKKLEAYGIGEQTLLAMMQSQGLTTLSGSITNGTQRTPIHVASVGNSEDEIANQIIYADPMSDKMVRIKDIAQVVREYDKTESYIEQNGNPCILLSLEMTPGNNIVAYGEEVDEILNDFRANELPDDVKITRIADQPKVVGLSVTSFLRDLLISMAIIILVMILLFPLRSAIVAAITIPLSTFISVAGMYMSGIELNIVTLAALIVVLGMIVDNSIVVIDGYLEYVTKGLSPKDAAIKSVSQYFMPMMLATVCICGIFYPFLLTMKGVFYDALRDFPWTITINLMVSLILAVGIIPFLCVKIIGEPKKKGGKHLTGVVQKTYDKILVVLFRHPWLTIGSGVVLVLLSLLIIPSLKVRLFPYADRDQFAIEIFLPNGKGLDDTRVVADSLRHVMQSDDRVVGITSFIGCSSPRFQTVYAPQIAGRNFAQFIVNTSSQETTLDLLAEYQPRWSEAFPEAYIKFKRLDYLSVEELEYRFYGENIDTLRNVAEQMMVQMRQMPEIEWVHTDYFQPYPIVNVTLDPVTSAQMGITRATASLGLNVSTGDVRIGQMWEDDYELPIVVKDNTKLTFADIADVGITSAASALAGSLGTENSIIPLRQVAHIEPAWTEGSIVHRGGERCMTVTARFAQGVYAAPVEERLADMMHEIQLPAGVRSEVGGELEYGDEALPQIFGGIAIAMIIVFFFLLFNFKGFGITTVCMVALALMAPGALLGLGLMDRTLGLTSIFGLITLMGMIMRNEILIFEHANGVVKKYIEWNPQYKREDYNHVVHRAAIEAGSRRMVPIFLTTATTAVGVVPMIIAQSSFWMPVGVTIFAGGIGALILVVSILPIVYWKISTK
ncbi:MAG: efflux RND transporter permease subunit [Bacteroidales bacterium]|nr:efflux RND transporter permease subunit [Bacteroidales bacterium]